jgi:hypothetical protein
MAATKHTSKVGSGRRATSTRVVVTDNSGDPPCGQGRGQGRGRGRGRERGRATEAHVVQHLHKSVNEASQHAMTTCSPEERQGSRAIQEGSCMFYFT